MHGDGRRIAGQRPVVGLIAELIGAVEIERRRVEEVTVQVQRYTAMRWRRDGERVHDIAVWIAVVVQHAVGPSR